MCTSLVSASAVRGTGAVQAALHLEVCTLHNLHIPYSLCNCSLFCLTTLPPTLSGHKCSNFYNGPWSCFHLIPFGFKAHSLQKHHKQYSAAAGSLVKDSMHRWHDNALWLTLNVAKARRLKHQPLLTLVLSFFSWSACASSQFLREQVLGTKCPLQTEHLHKIFCQIKINETYGIIYKPPKRAGGFLFLSFRET